MAGYAIVWVFVFFFLLVFLALTAYYYLAKLVRYARGRLKG
jgi:hypothetical protein